MRYQSSDVILNNIYLCIGFNGIVVIRIILFKYLELVWLQQGNEKEVLRLM